MSPHHDAASQRADLITQRYRSQMIIFTLYEKVFLYIVSEMSGKVSREPRHVGLNCLLYMCLKLLNEAGKRDSRREATAAARPVDLGDCRLPWTGQFYPDATDLTLAPRRKSHASRVQWEW